MPENKHLRLLLVLLYIALGALGLWLTARFLVPWLLPFLIAWALAALLEPPVRLCMDGLHLPRWAAVHPAADRPHPGAALSGRLAGGL